MIDQERVREMTKLVAYEQREGKNTARSFAITVGTLQPGIC